MAKPIASGIRFAAIAVALAAAGIVLADQSGAPPGHRVAAMYFHRTQRCPTCKKISAYIEEAIRTGFAAEMRHKTVSVHMIDYQNPENQKYTKAYRITGPTLVLADVREGNVAAWKTMPKVWSLVGTKGEFLKYVQNGVSQYLDTK